MRRSRVISSRYGRRDIVSRRKRASQLQQGLKGSNHAVVTMHTLRIRANTTLRLTGAGLFLLFAACSRQSATTTTPAPAPSPRQPVANVIADGSALLRAMHDRYPRWYRTVTFVQKTTISRPSGELIQTWYEAGSLPGRLRIDTDIATKSGTLFARDSIYTFASGKLVRADSGFNELLILGFDVYAQPPQRTEALLRQRGFDLSRIRETMWQGQPVYVVGAADGDTTTKQFWVSKRDLLFVRLLEKGAQGAVDIRFDKYVRAGQGWIAELVTQLVNGKPRVIEEYSDVHVDVQLNESLFNPADWATTGHWAKPSPPRRNR